MTAEAATSYDTRLVHGTFEMDEGLADERAPAGVDRETGRSPRTAGAVAPVWDHAFAALEGFHEMTGWLWWLAIAFFGVGDFVTTAGAELGPSIAEGNPVVAGVLGTRGFAGFLLLKAVVLVAAYLVWRSLRPPHDVGVPLALAVVGVGLTTWNAFVVGFVLAG